MMAGTAVRNGTANLVLAQAVTGITCTVSIEISASPRTTLPHLRPAKTDMGPRRNCSAQGADASGGLSHNCPYLQSAVAITQTDDGE